MTRMRALATVFAAAAVAFGACASGAEPRARLSDKDMDSIGDQLSRSRALQRTFRVDRAGLAFEKTFGHCSEHYLTFSPDSRWLATCGRGGVTNLVDPANGRIGRRLSVSRGTLDVRFSPDGRYLLTAAMQVDIWDLRRSRVVHALIGHENPVIEIAFSPDRRMVATAGWDRVINLWTVGGTWRHRWEAPRPRHSMRKTRDTLLAFSADGRRIAYDNGRAITFLASSSGKVVATRRLRRGKGDNQLVALSGDARWAAAATDDSAITLVDLRERSARPRKLVGHQLWVYALAFSSDARFLLTTGSDMKLILWEAATGRRQRSWMVGGRNERWPAAVAISPDNRWVATRNSANVVRVWDLGEIAGGPGR